MHLRVPCFRFEYFFLASKKWYRRQLPSEIKKMSSHTDISGHHIQPIQCTEDANSTRYDPVLLYTVKNEPHCLCKPLPFHSISSTCIVWRRHRLPSIFFSFRPFIPFPPLPSTNYADFQDVKRRSSYSNLWEADQAGLGRRHWSFHDSKLHRELDKMIFFPFLSSFFLKKKRLSVWHSVLRQRIVRS